MKRLAILSLSALILVSCDRDPPADEAPRLYLPEEDSRVVSVERLGDGLTLVYDRDAEEIGLFEGQFVAGRGGGGYLLQVKAVELSGDTAELDTAEATLATALVTGSLHQTYPLQGEWQVVDSGDTSATEGALDLDGWVVFDGYSLVAELMAQIVEGSLDLDPALVLDVEIEDGEVTSFGYVVQGQLALDFTTEVTVEIGYSYSTERVVARYVQPLSSAVGGCPLEGELAVDLYAGLEISAEMGSSTQATIQLEGTFEAGARYEDGQWSAVWDTETVQGSDREPVMEAEGEVTTRLWLRPVVTATFFGREGPAVDIEPFVGNEVVSMGPLEWSVTAGLDGAVAMDTRVFSSGLDAFAQDLDGVEEEVARTQGTWTGYTMVDAGSTASCAVVDDDSIVCWGDSSLVTPPAGAFKQVSVGHAHICALRTDHLAWCWGEGLAVTEAPAAMAFSQITSGENFSCGIREDDAALHCWGRGDRGQIAAPVGQFTAIDAGRFHACALDTAGQARCWGADDDGQSSPPEAPFVAITAGFRHSCGVSSAGDVQCWGCGSGETVVCSPPPGFYRAVSAGHEHTCAIRGDDKVLCWGSSTSEATEPPPYIDYLQVSSGFAHTCGLTTDSNVSCWGDDVYGQATPP